MTTLERIVECKDVTDEMLAIIAEDAIKREDIELLKKIAIHPNAGYKTLPVIAKSGF